MQIRANLTYFSGDRLDAKVLSWLRKTAEKKGLPYPSLVNEILAGEMRKAS
jgi:hypothetical protein